MDFHVIMRSYEIFSYNYRIRWLIFFFSVIAMHFRTNMWVPRINFELQQWCCNAWLYYIVYSNNLVKINYNFTNKSLVLVLFCSDSMLLRAGVALKNYSIYRILFNLGRIKKVQANAGHMLDNNQVLMVWRPHRGTFNQLFNNIILWICTLGDLSRTGDHTHLLFCSHDTIAANPQRKDLAATH